jgi:serine protease Do
MANLDFESIDPALPPPRPTTPPVRPVFLRVLLVLVVITSLFYGVTYMVDRIGYSWEAGRSRAASEALAKLDDAGVLARASALFRMATQVITPAVVNIQTSMASRGGADAGLGSGVIIDKQNGYIVTNAHVVHDASTIIVRIGRSQDVEGTLIGLDELTDLAVVQVKVPLGVAAEWGDSDKMEVGDWVLAVGSPFALDRTVTAGIVSATGRHGLGKSSSYEDYIQTDAPINPGNSGGPLINLRGQVIGINTAIINPRDGQGIGLAMSSDVASKVVAQIIKSGKVTRAYLGVIPAPLSTAFARESGLPEGQEGALVNYVRPDSPAAKAGLRPGDILVGLDGKEVTDPGSLRVRAFTLPIGSPVGVDFYRGGKKQRIDVTVEAMPEHVAGNFRDLGLDVADAPPPGPGVVITSVRPKSPAEQAGLQPGRRIVAIGRQPVRNKAEFDAVVSARNLIDGLPVGILGPDGQVFYVYITPAGGIRP